MNTFTRENLRRISFPSIVLLALTIFIGLSHSPAWGQTYKTLAQARQAAAGAKTQDSLKTVLLSAIPQLSVRDGIALCTEYESKVSPTFKAELRATVGGLYLLLGQAGDAAAWYTKAAALDARYVAQALRISISVGDQKSVVSLLEHEAISTDAKAMFDVWLSLYENDYASASLKAKDALTRLTDPQIRRELLFLQYLADFGQYGTAQSTLIRDFPDSIEADMLRGEAFPSPWFVISLGLSWLDAPTLLSDFEKKSVPGGQETMDNESIYWLQVGYFSSKDNAERLFKTLSAKKFQGRIVESKNAKGESRWAVQVMAQKEDWQNTRSLLMDLGYDSYLVDP
ncbi:MAG: SPOR domain-containing protein [Rectinema sp.]